MNPSFYSLPAAAGAILTLVVAIYATRHRVRGARVFAVLMATTTVLLVCSAFATSSTSLETALAFQKVGGVANATLPAVLFWFVARFTGARWMNLGPVLGGIFAITLAYDVVSTVEPFSSLVTRGYSFSTEGGYAAVSRTRGPLWLPFIVFTSSLVTVSLGQLIWQSITSPPVFRRQLLTIVAGALLPLASNLLQFAGGAPLRGYDMSGVGYGGSAILIAWALFRFRGLSAAPVSQSHLRASIVANMTDAVIALDSAGTVLDLNPQAERLLNVTVSEAFGKPIGQVFPALHVDGTTRWSDQIVEIEDAGTLRELEVRRMQVTEEPGREPGQLLMLRDVTVQRQLEAELSRLAYQDSLTGLANRVHFMGRLNDALHRKLSVAVLFLDLDGFKTVNDSLGHGEGDMLLHAIAMRWRSMLKPESVLARFGGDEFVILLSPAGSENEVASTVDDLMQSLSMPFRLTHREINVTVSIGVTIDLKGERPAVDLIREADTAMYAAKEAGKARSATYTAAMHDEAMRRLNLGGDLRQAIESGGLRIAFTQAIDPLSRATVGSEAVITWPHPTRGDIDMDEVFDLATEQGLALPLSLWMIRESCRALAAWRSARPGREQSIVRVTVPLRVLQQDGLVGDVREILDELNLPPSSLWLDVFDVSTRESFNRLDTSGLFGLGVRVGGGAARSGESTEPLDRAVGPLTARELDVALLVAEGLSNAQIAERLYLSPHTIATYVKHIMAKLDLQTRAQIATYITRAGQIQSSA